MTGIAVELVRICRHFGVFERESVCCGEVTVPQCLTLQQLLSGPSPMSELAAQAGTSISAMTRMVDGLERHGWVARRRGGDDRRRVLVELTRAGTSEAERLRELTGAMLSQVVKRIPRAKRSQVSEALELLRRAMDEARSCGGRCCE